MFFLYTLVHLIFFGNIFEPAQATQELVIEGKSKAVAKAKDQKQKLNVIVGCRDVSQARLNI